MHVYALYLLYSYAEVRAEQRRELGIEESPPEVTADLKVRLLFNTRLIFLQILFKDTQN